MSDDDPTKPDLSLVETDWMIEELQRRCDASVVVMNRPAPAGSTKDDCAIYYSGGMSTCIGLAVRARALITRDSIADDDEVEE